MAVSKNAGCEISGKNLGNALIKGGTRVNERNLNSKKKRRRKVLNMRMQQFLCLESGEKKCDSEWFGGAWPAGRYLQTMGRMPPARMGARSAPGGTHMRRAMCPLPPQGRK